MSSNSLSLGDLLEVTSSKRIHMADYVDAGIPFYRGKEVIERAKGNKVSTELFIHPTQFKNIKSKFGSPKLGDILLTSVGTLGVPLYISENVDFYFKDGNLTWLRNFKQGVNPKFIYYWLTSPKTQQKLDEISIGSTQRALTIIALKSLKIELPPERTQAAIVEALDALTDRLTLLRETNKTLESIAQAIFKSWFVDFDPVRAKMEGRQPEGMDETTAALFPSTLKETELGIVPSGWCLQTLNDAYEINPFRKLSKGCPAKYLDMANVPTNGFSVENIIAREFKSGSKFTLHDTLLARITPCLENGKAAYVDFLEEGEVAAGSTEFIVLKPKSPLPPFHAYLLCRSPSFREHAIKSMSGTSGRQRVQNDMLSIFVIAIPTAEIVEKFAEICSAIQTNVTSNSTQAKLLSKLRDTLLPRLISGKLRLPEAQEQIENALS